MRGTHRRRLPGGWLLLTLTLLTTVATPAAAGDEEDIGAGVAVASFAMVDLSFSIRAAVLAANDGDAVFGYSLAQSLVATPQALAFNGAIVGLMHTRDGAEAFAALHVPATMTTALAVHGLWSLATPDEDAALMFLASTTIGVNTMWTSFLLGTATTSVDNFGDEAALAGIYEVITTVPGVAIGLHQALETDRFQVGWIGITGWSGLLALHGVLFSTGVLNPDRSDDWAGHAGAARAESAVLRGLREHHIGLAPASLGAPIEGAPHTPGLVLSGVL